MNELCVNGRHAEISVRETDSVRSRPGQPGGGVRFPFRRHAKTHLRRAEGGRHRRLNDEWRMTNDERNPKTKCLNALSCVLAGFVIRISSFLRISSFVIRVSQ